MREEQIVLVDKHNNPIGVAPKLASHNAETPLHRAFSLFLFNGKEELLIQQRSRHKKVWPLVWSNSCCGHPGPGESMEEAIKRRLDQELGIKDDLELHLVLPDYRYRFERDGIVENEYCPVYIAKTNGVNPKLNRDEVEAIHWISWFDFLKIAEQNIKEYSEWSLDEARLLENNPMFNNLWQMWYNQEA